MARISLQRKYLTENPLHTRLQGLKANSLQLPLLPSHLPTNLSLRHLQALHPNSFHTRYQNWPPGAGATEPGEVSQPTQSKPSKRDPPRENSSHSRIDGRGEVFVFSMINVMEIIRPDTCRKSIAGTMDFRRNTVIEGATTRKGVTAASVYKLVNRNSGTGPGVTIQQQCTVQETDIGHLITWHRGECC